MTPQVAGPSRKSQGTGSGRRVPMLLIGLAMGRRLARDTRTHQAVIMAVIVVAAAAGMGKASRASAFARLVAWDKRQTAKPTPAT